MTKTKAFYPQYGKKAKSAAREIKKAAQIVGQLRLQIKYEF
jgi:hypothetical protein